MWTSFFGACEFTSRGPESGPPAVRVRRSGGVQKTSKGLKRRSCQNANTQVSCLIRVSTGINVRHDSGLQTLRCTLAGPDNGLQALRCTLAGPDKGLQALCCRLQTRDIDHQLVTYPFDVGDWLEINYWLSAGLRVQGT